MESFIGSWANSTSLSISLPRVVSMVTRLSLPPFDGGPETNVLVWSEGMWMGGVGLVPMREEVVPALCSVTLVMLLTDSARCILDTCEEGRSKVSV